MVVNIPVCNQLSSVITNFVSQITDGDGHCLHASNYEQLSIHTGCQCIVMIVIKSLFRELFLNMDSEFSFKSLPSSNAANTCEDQKLF